MKTTNLKIHILLHADYVSPGVIYSWIKEHSHSYSVTNLHKGDPLPALSDFNLLIIMGGPMNACDNNIYPWMDDEANFIKRSIQSGKHIIGICLGAQLIAKVLGSKVYDNSAPEIGWHKIIKSNDFEHPVKDLFPEEHMTLHWHGQIFDLPFGAIQLAHSDHTPCQGFVYADNVVGLQFHPEVTAETIDAYLNNDKAELVKSDSVQTKDEILNGKKYIEETNQLLKSILNYLSEF